MRALLLQISTTADEAQLRFGQLAASHCRIRGHLFADVIVAAIPDVPLARRMRRLAGIDGGAAAVPSGNGQETSLQTAQGSDPGRALLSFAVSAQLRSEPHSVAEA